MAHRNSKLTPSGRLLLVRRVEAGWSAARESRGNHWLGRVGDRPARERSGRTQGRRSGRMVIGRKRAEVGSRLAGSALPEQ